MGVRFASGDVQFTPDGDVVFGCPHTCSFCSGDSVGYFDVTFSGVTLCSCVGFGSPATSSAALSYLSGWTPNATFRLYQHSLSQPCVYLATYPAVLRVQNYTSGNCTGSPTSTLDATINVVAKVKTGGFVEVSIGRSYSPTFVPVTSECLFYQGFVSTGTDCAAVSASGNNNATSSAWCSGFVVAYGHSGSVTITSP